MLSLDRALRNFHLLYSHLNGVLCQASQVILFHRHSVRVRFNVWRRSFIACRAFLVHVILSHAVEASGILESFNISLSSLERKGLKFKTVQWVICYLQVLYRSECRVDLLWTGRFATLCSLWALVEFIILLFRFIFSNTCDPSRDLHSRPSPSHALIFPHWWISIWISQTMNHIHLSLMGFRFSIGIFRPRLPHIYL